MLPLAAGKHELGDTVKNRNNGRYISDDKISNQKHIFPDRLFIFFYTQVNPLCSLRQTLTMT